MKNRKEILANVQLLRTAFQEGRIKRPEQHEVHPELPKASRENYLYFTLPPSINFQRSSPAMWKSALATYRDEETRFVFYPEKVVQHDREMVKNALFKHRLATQYNRHTKIWYAICETLNRHFQDDPKQVLQEGNFDVPQILDLIRIKHKSDFPYLAGLKLSNYWLFMLSRFTDVRLSNMQEISIIPDTHIIKSSVELGLVPPQATPAMVDAAWRDLLKDSEISPAEMHSVLWNWSRAKFQPRLPVRVQQA